MPSRAPLITCAHVRAQRTRAIRVLDGGTRCEHYCRTCRAWLAPSAFAGSALRAATTHCRVHFEAARIARRRARAARGGLAVQLERIYLNLRMRERGRGAREPSMRQHEVEALVCRLSRSPIIDMANVALVRRDESRPFDARTNAELVSRAECYRRGNARAAEKTAAAAAPSAAASSKRRAS